MLKYYAYYSVGGYKEFFLGDTENKEEFTYYFPLISFLEDEARNNETVTARVEELKALPRIEPLSEDNTFGLSESAQPLFKGDGFELIYKHLSGDLHALAFGSLSNNAKDDMGKPIPFQFIITGEGKKDLQALDVLAAYAANNLKKVQGVIAGFIGMNYERNGLEFSLARCNAWIAETLKEQKVNDVLTIEGSEEAKAEEGAVALLVLPQGWTKQDAMAKQELVGKRVNYVKVGDLISKDDPEKLLSQVEAMASRITDEKRKVLRWKIFMIVATIAALVLGIVLF